MTHRELYDRLMTFAIAVTRFAEPLLDRAATANAADQLLRAATGAASNYRAANHGRSNAEFRSKLNIAVEEIDEARNWLDYFVKVDFTGVPDARGLLEESVQLCRILGASKRTANRNARRHRPDRLKPPTPRTNRNRQDR